MIRRTALLTLISVALAATLQTTAGPAPQGPPLKVTGANNSKAVAIVVGISNYDSRDVPRVEFAIKDAEAVSRVLVDTLGYSADNVLVRTDKDASAGRFKQLIQRQLKNLVTPGESDVFFYYSGHGAPNANSKDAYLLPWDYDFGDEPNNNTAYAIRDLYTDLAALKAKTVTVMLEACFSGQTDSGKTLLRSSSALILVNESPMGALGGNSVLITASGGQEVASWDRAHEHGLMTYHWLEALRGAPEAQDANGRVTPTTLKPYLQERVSRDARRLYGRNQTPDVRGDANRVLAALPVSAVRTGAARIVDAFGSLRVTIDLGGDLFIDGVPQGAIPAGRAFQQDKILAGPHEVEVRKQGYETQHRTVIVESDKATTESFRLTADLPNRPPVQPANPPAIPTANTGGDPGFEFVKIAAGTFRMGCSPGDIECFQDENPAHEVNITRAFELGKYEVTQQQWQKVMGTNPSRVKGDDLPIEVNWNDAQEFLYRLNERSAGKFRYRLPTEAEWEYAARATGMGAFIGESLESIAWHAGNSGGQPHPVGKKQANRWGLFDMQGNVAEWVQDRLGRYTEDSVEDPQGPPTGDRIARGGSWNDASRRIRVSYRESGPANGPAAGHGLRLVRESTVPISIAEIALNMIFDGARFVEIKAGRFQMGCLIGEVGCATDEQPPRQVTIMKPFEIGKKEVTQAEWERTMGSNPSFRKGDDLPVHNVTWDDAQEYLRRLNADDGVYTYRLPTEAEWEFAARSGTSGNGTGNDIDARAWHSSNSGGQAHAVGGKQSNGSGLFDMQGNVAEWVEDWFGPYRSTDETDPKGPGSGSRHVIRGGSWNNAATDLRFSRRASATANTRNSDIGFRVVRVRKN